MSVLSLSDHKIHDQSKLFCILHYSNLDCAELDDVISWGFSCKDVRPMGRVATGVKGIALRRQDVVVAGVILKEYDQTTEIMSISANASTMNNLCHCFLATDVVKLSDQHLEETEDISIHLLSVDEVRNLLKENAFKQATMLAPLWKYFAEHHLI